MKAGAALDDRQRAQRDDQTFGDQQHWQRTLVSWAPAQDVWTLATAATTAAAASAERAHSAMDAAAVASPRAN